MPIYDSLKRTDFLIVGQGIAGSVLAFTLWKRGATVRVVADERPTSTAVAAGLYNPITGRKLVKTWNAEVLFPFLEQFYQSLEAEIGVKVLHPCHIYRPFRNAHEQAAYLKQCSEPDVAPFVDVHPDNSPFEHWVHNPLGGIQTTSSGWLNTQLFLQKVRTWLIEKNLFVSETFDYQDLSINDTQLTWKNEPYGKVIFCEGVSGAHNPWFGWLPFSPVKGELLQLEIKGIDTHHVVNQGVWLLPVGEGVFKLGATYEWDDLSWQPSAKARDYLLSKVQPWLKVPFDIKAQLAGVRPATADRRPFVGLHPIHKSMGIFNGFGSKGVSLTPYLAASFVDLLESQKELDPEVNIERYFSLYYSANTPA